MEVSSYALPPPPREKDPWWHLRRSGLKSELDSRLRLLALPPGGESKFDLLETMTSLYDDLPLETLRLCEDLDEDGRSAVRRIVAVRFLEDLLTSVHVDDELENILHVDQEWTGLVARVIGTTFEHDLEPLLFYCRPSASLRQPPPTAPSHTQPIGRDVA